MATKPASDRSGGSAALARQAQLQDDEAEPDLIGSEVDGRYRVIELIGEGGMGKVYLAEHVEIGKRVALKVLHPSYSRMPDLVERFRREARAASKIGHPNIVDVTDSGTTADGSVYFVMEYLEGVELGSVIEREGALDVARGLKIAGQICRALSAAHREGIIHRDLKPENIFLITRDGTADVVKVLDFGIAKTTEAEAARERRLTSPGMAMGTPEYMSPEQAAGRPADARCDVYALGAIMYEMVTGIPPYSGDNFMEILTKKATQDPPPPHLVRGELASQVSELVMAAMARNPIDRPQTMEALEYELNKCLAGRGVAVAQILGMTTDPHVVATLNPGLSMRQFDDSVVVPRAQTTSTGGSLSRAGTHSGMTELPGMFSGPSMATGQSALYTNPGMPRAATDAGGSYPGLPHQRLQSSPSISAPAPAGSGTLDPAVLTSQPVVALRRSGWFVLGWMVLAAVLFGGIGALLYTALGERSAASKALAAVPGEASASKDRDRDEPGSGAVAKSSASDGSNAVRSAVGSARDARSEPDAVTSSGGGAEDVRPATTTGRPAAGEDRFHKRTPVRTGGNKRVAQAPAPVGEDKDPKDGKSIAALISKARGFESSGQWSQARAVYEKLGQTKGYSLGEALYRQAYAAFQANTTAEAATLAEKAAHEPGSFKTQAMMLYGDAMLKLGNKQRAKGVFSSLYNNNSSINSVERAAALRKLAQCNKELGLPEGDGVERRGPD